MTTPEDRATIVETRPDDQDDWFQAKLDAGDARFQAKLDAGDARHAALLKEMEEKLDAFGDRLLLQCSSILFAAFALMVAAVRYLP